MAMFRLVQPLQPVLCLLGLLVATACPAEPWEDPLHHLVMDPPPGWAAMDDALLAKANAGVNHVTGRGFIGGYSAYPADTLVFPYMLVQFKSYNLLPETSRPIAQDGTAGKLELIARITRAFSTPLPLSEDTDLGVFQRQNTNASAKLLALTEDAKFDFAGSIPLEDGSADIRYHSHGVLGRDGVAIVTLFTIERFNDMQPVIDGTMRTLAFAEGRQYADLPDEPPEPEPAAIEEEVADQAIADEQGETAAAQADLRTITPVLPQPTAETAEEGPTPANNSAVDEVEEEQTNTLLILLGVLGGAGVAIAVVVVVAARQQRARRERAEARRARLERAGR